MVTPRNPQITPHLAFGSIGDDVDDCELLGDTLEHKLEQGSRADAASPTHKVRTSGLTYCTVS